VKTSKITEMTVETDEVFIIRRAQARIRAWCAECAAEVEMITSEQAIPLMGASLREIACRLEAGQIHFTEMNDGRLLVCVNSLAP
jgi:hypothetical protein